MPRRAFISAGNAHKIRERASVIYTIKRLILRISRGNGNFASSRRVIPGSPLFLFLLLQQFNITIHRTNPASSNEDEEEEDPSVLRPYLCTTRARAHRQIIPKREERNDATSRKKKKKRTIRQLERIKKPNGNGRVDGTGREEQESRWTWYGGMERRTKRWLARTSGMRVRNTPGAPLPFRPRLRCALRAAASKPRGSPGAPR